MSSAAPNIHPTTQQPYIMRLPQVKALTGFGKTHIYSMMAKGEFPKSKKIGAYSVGWSSVEIQQWIDSKLQATPTERTQ